MRIAFVTLEYESGKIGGAGTYANCLTKGLGSKGVEVHVITPSTEMAAKEERTTGVEVHHLTNIWRYTLPAVTFWLRLPGEIAKLHETYKFDIVHFNGLCYRFPEKNCAIRHMS
jgi:glycogen synthase